MVACRICGIGGRAHLEVAPGGLDTTERESAWKDYILLSVERERGNCLSHPNEGDALGHLTPGRWWQPTLPPTAPPEWHCPPEVRSCE
jgi:hypothetical protein